MTVATRWLQELETPTAEFFTVFAERVAEPDGLRDAVRDAVKTLVPRIDWEAYLPHVPHGILGLRAVFRLRPLLEEASFLRALAVQLHMAAHEGRRAKAAFEQVASAKGSGSWRNLEAFIAARKPGLAYAEAQGFELPGPDDFQRLARLVEPDMANVGHKAVFARHLADLCEQLERPKATGRRLFGLAAWLAATPEDLFWAKRAGKRFGDAIPPIGLEATPMDGMALEPIVRDVCDLGLVSLLDSLTARLRSGLDAGNLRAGLVFAAAEKQLDARRDLEGKTAWNFVYLATLNHPEAPAATWCQAAALVNLFPTEEAEARLQPHKVHAPSTEALLNAVLDGEAAPAMGQAQALLDAGQGEEALKMLAEAASRNDPAFNHAHQVLAVAAAADLLPRLPLCAGEAMLTALAKSLANSQGSGDLGRLADGALER
ncbi:MAG TPA: hypothetical protein VJ486_10290 [Geothrix sp.]|nr:hypothetical protein [Geothrix sp.]